MLLVSKRLRITVRNKLFDDSKIDWRHVLQSRQGVILVEKMTDKLQSCLSVQNLENVIDYLCVYEILYCFGLITRHLKIWVKSCVVIHFVVVQFKEGVLERAVLVRVGCDERLGIFN